MDDSDIYTPQPGEVNEAGEPKPLAILMNTFSREGDKLPAPNMGLVKTYFHASNKSTGALTLANLKAGETLVITSLVVNMENQSASPKFAEFIVKGKGEGLYASTGKIAANMTENMIELSGPLVFAYTASAAEKLEIEITLEGLEVQSRVNITYYTTTLTS